MTPQPQYPSNRLYAIIAAKLAGDLRDGRYQVGTKLPSERELAALHDVSRPVIREAMIALEVRGLVEVRVGSGVHVRALPDQDETLSCQVTAIEITEARLLIEAEAAALAATQITPDELAVLDNLVERIAAENRAPHVAEKADRAFHLAIAGASRNNALREAVERLWQLRRISPEAALLHEMARTHDVDALVDEHAAIVQALRQRDPAAARAAMRAHLLQVLESLVVASEERAIAAARSAAEANRDRLSRITA